MQFNSYMSTYDTVMMLDAKSVKHEEKATGKNRVDLVFESQLKRLYSRFVATGKKDHELAREINANQTEWKWVRAKRPYYDVYPGIVPYLIRLNLSKVPAVAFKTPIDQILFRFPVQNNPVVVSFRDGPCKGLTIPLSSVLVGIRAIDEDVEITKQFPPSPGERHLLTIFSWNAKVDKELVESHIISSLPLYVNQTVESCIQGLRNELGNGDMELESYIAVIRIITTACLLSTHWEDELVLPEVLKADEERWIKTHDSKYLERAKKRGVYGWSVGKAFENMQVSPHWRGPSPLALYRTGPGRKTLLYRYRRGTMVHRDKIDKLPTGHEDSPPVES